MVDDGFYRCGAVCRVGCAVGSAEFCYLRVCYVDAVDEDGFSRLREQKRYVVVQGFCERASSAQYFVQPFCVAPKFCGKFGLRPPFFCKCGFDFFYSHEDRIPLFAEPSREISAYCGKKK